jgi:hypothetical protein
MNLDPLRRYCSTLPGATRDIKLTRKEQAAIAGMLPLRRKA